MSTIGSVMPMKPMIVRISRYERRYMTPNLALAASPVRGVSDEAAISARLGRSGALTSGMSRLTACLLSMATLDD